MEEDTDASSRERRVALGWAIRVLRSDRSQAEFGTQIGISQTRLSRWEHGDVDLSYEQVRRVERRPLAARRSASRTVLSGQ